MKKTLFKLFPILFIGATVIIFLQIWVLKKEAICIAVVGPTSDDQSILGKAMLKGINLYLDKINRGGGINGRKIKLLIFDDNNDELGAIRTASRIADEREALLVLGHYYSRTSVAAGRIYKRMRVPAITASATAEKVTYGNDCYFRIIPSNAFGASFIVNFVNKNLRQPSVNIVFCKDDYGRSLAEDLKKACQRFGIEVKNKWEFSGKNDEAVRIASGIEVSETILLAMHAPEAAKLVALLKGMNTDYQIVGGDALSTELFLSELKKYPMEQSVPGYCSNGIYAVSPFMTGVANEKAYSFSREFVKRYNERPSWVTACYYDAIHVAVEAIRRAEIQGSRENIRSDRLKVRNALASFHNSSNAIMGVTGDIYFDPDGDADRPLAIGIYKDQKLIPGFSQYQISERKDTGDMFKKSLDGDVIIIGGKMMNKTRIVYAGIYVNEISNLDMENGTYTADFYLWFHYSGAFDDTGIEFTNSVSPIILNPVFDKDGTRVYYVRADFKADFDFRAYPFDQHKLRISFRHTKLTRDSLTYLPDRSGVPPFVNEEKIGKTRFDAVSEWSLGDMLLYQDIISNVSSLGNPRFFDSRNTISHSRFNAEICLKRLTPLRSFFHIFVMIMTLCLTHFISARRLRIRMMILMAILVVNFFYHLKVLLELPAGYLTFIEYVFLSTYILVTVSVFISASKYRFDA
ncbi:ABC transporter substrate-binding protein [Desulfobacterales bacterium HSG2]|nr:ABC transporter substrate-binding protein [Desulfobacterales bacterium HSG2]